jgi:hypothetical protein
MTVAVSFGPSTLPCSRLHPAANTLSGIRAKRRNERIFIYFGQVFDSYYIPVVEQSLCGKSSLLMTHELGFDIQQ